ncbi:hypothetical protein Trydic_g21292 [Trypoxylus dichotomus]
MHNVVTLLDSFLDVVEDKECMERCISYCAQVVDDNWNNLIILSGTVFSQILVWWPTKSADKLCPVLYRLIGHKGVIFSIDYNPTLNIICSTSDDRTAKVWSIKNETLAKELTQNPISINLKHTLIGHTARVFKCKILSDSIITAGEDGIVNFWDKNGELIKKSDVHQEGPVWSLDCCEKTDTIVTGGGDCGVFMFKLHSKVLKSSLETELDNPRKLLIFSLDNVAYLTENGLFLMYKRKAQQFAGLAVHEDLKSYGLLEKSPCGCRIALAGYRGTIHVYRVVPRWLDYMYSCQIKSEERIYSIHWLSCQMLLTCGAKGVLTLWIMQETVMMPIHFWELPHSKERWSTAACFCGIKTVLVGDRRGTLYVYSTDSSQPLQIIKKAHNYLGISAVYFRNDKVISLGRNSTINEYIFDNKKQHLIQISSHKVPFTWLTSLLTQKSTGPPLLQGFSGTNFIIYDYIARRTLFEVECGGGHRSWDVFVTGDNLIFSYIKNKRINIIECSLGDVVGVDVIKGYHLNEVNVLKTIKCDRESLEYFFISGGEDTVIRLCFKSFKDDLSDFKYFNVLKSHLSSIRTISLTKVNEDKYFMFSGGGRSQIIFWELSIDKVGNENVVNCSEKFNYYEEVSHKGDSETRVMDLTTVTIKETMFLLAGYSDGIVRIFKVNPDNSNGTKLVYVNHIPIYKFKCIFKISILIVENYFILTTMASDGYIVFTNVTNEFVEVQTGNPQPLASVKAHQSGINSYSSLYTPSSGELVYLTGGDDTAIVLNAFNVRRNEDNIKLECLCSFSGQNYHGAQVTGTYITENYFLTASIDQKVLLFTWNLRDKFSVDCVKVFRSGICDIQGMECVLLGDVVKVIVYGRGCEIITCRLLDTFSKVN